MFDSEENEIENFDENEDHNEEDEESSEESRKRPRKTRKTDGHRFILDEAEVDDDVDEDEEWEEGADEIIDTNEFSEANRARELDSHRRLQKMFSDQREDEIEQYYLKKYAGQQSNRVHDQVEGLPDDIAQHALLPGIKDPDVWIVKCKKGKERSSVDEVNQKFFAHQHSDERMKISEPAFARQGTKGYIYIRAYRRAHVKQAIEGIRSLKIGNDKPCIIPRKEMADVLRVTQDKASIRPDQWVRVKRGKYREDIALVDSVDTASGEATLKLIPRIDYTCMRGAPKAKLGENNKRKVGHRPAAKLFNPEAIRAIGGKIKSYGDFQIFEKDRYRRGLLYKEFPIVSLIVDGIKPSLTELSKFDERSDGFDVADTYVSEGKGHSFALGDNVIVTEGDLRQLIGKITAIENDKITLLPKLEGFKDPLDFQPHELKKLFKKHDHVKIIAGRHEGETGFIVRVDEKEIAMLSDLTMHEVKILPKDCQICSDTATGVDSLGKFGKSGATKKTYDMRSGILAGLTNPPMTSPRHAGGGGGRGGGGKRGGGGQRSFMPSKGGRTRDKELIGKQIRITEGLFKNYYGIVREADDKRAQVELHSTGLTITVEKSHIAVSAQTGEKLGNVSYNPYQTPMSIYGRHTPLASGSRTPRADGSRTPVYDPSKTPRPNDDDFSEPSPSPSFLNPPTPGYHDPSTPQGGPYTPQTPGALYSSGHHDPYCSQPSPGILSAPSPASNYLTSPSPAGYGQPGPSPAGYSAFSPMTPGGPGGPGSAYNPQTPGAGMIDNYNAWQDWQTPDIEVRIRASHDDPDLIGQSGIIRGISGGMSTVFLPNEDRVVNILSRHLEPIRPTVGDHVKVILGDQDREATGRVLSIDGTEAVVDIDGEVGAKLFCLNYLCRMKLN